jgi:diguanylate cyclase (GGDEF)-like protein
MVSDILRGLENTLNVFYNLIFISVFTLYSFKYVNLLSLYTSSLSLISITIFTKELHWVESYQLPILIFIVSYAIMNFFRANNTKTLLAEVTLEENAKKFQLLSNQDFLTKLANRNALDVFINDHISLSVLNNDNIGIIMFDVDFFKSYNDCYSHIKGDECLKKIGNILQKYNKDNFHIFRYGGEEFIGIGVNKSEEEMKQIATNIRDDVYDLNLLRYDLKKCHHNRITISSGISYGTINHIYEFDNLVKLADDQLYNSKHNGKNCTYYLENKIN